ncbi:hypothetical protein [Methylomonas koyamae]|uniref:hypothetical protein n=1 Tax=Methylomonas koyamae TaxID=702114 RepID=UPI0006D177C8|nr:hypothetical protein [Methylomonas koyamae]
MNRNADIIFTVESNQFTPRAKNGERVQLRPGLPAEVGDIVATTIDGKLELALYCEGMHYEAVEVAIFRKHPAAAQS